SQARGAADARMGGTAGPDQGSIRSLAAVVFYAVLLREWDHAGRGGRGVRQALQGLSRAIRDAYRRCIRASADPSVEFECRKDPGLAGASADGAAGEAHHGGAVDAVSRGLSAGC